VALVDGEPTGLRIGGEAFSQTGETVGSAHRESLRSSGGDRGTLSTLLLVPSWTVARIAGSGARENEDRLVDVCVPEPAIWDTYDSVSLAAVRDTQPRLGDACCGRG